ncbi:MAG: DUF4382 domain-containing protein [Gemmatimonadaceae bacterium]
MPYTRWVACAALIAATACASDSPTRIPAGQGMVSIQLTDAPFPFDSVKSVDIFVIRIDAKLADADSAECERHLGDTEKDSSDWVTLAEPNRSIDLVALRGGKVSDIGQKALPVGTYRSLRLVIDPSKSSITLKNGIVLTRTSLPAVYFPSAARSGIKVKLTKPIEVTEGNASTLLIDFSLDESFVIVGKSIQRFGLLFRPVIRATISAGA